jgi:poly(hydroxyalkanoate) depolymerase family esterase
MPSLQDMLEATELVRSGSLKEAISLINAKLRGNAQGPTQGADPASAAAAGGQIIELTRSGETGFFEFPWSGRPEMESNHAPRRDARSTAAGLRDRLRLSLPPDLHRVRPDTKIPEGASFLDHSCSSPQGNLTYKFYVPSGYNGESIPLLVMLHGCTQSPDDFAAGTHMNIVAEEHNILVAYPAQPRSANASKCWNWFRSSDQRRGAGEPAMIAAMTRQVMERFPVQRARVYVAGLSAGGAAAAVLGAAYPDIFSAIGIHSGLACGAAHDLSSAMAAMRTGGAPAPISSTQGSARPVRTIVFHGDRDNTVNPINGELVSAQFQEGATPCATKIIEGRAPGGLAYTRTIHHSAQGSPLFEKWVIHGAGHAWSGGSPGGSYTEPRGPDASREMLRFFLDDELGSD